MLSSSVRKTPLSSFIAILLPAGTHLLLTVILLIAPLSALQAENRTVLVIGDSLSAAYNMDRDQGWVHLLRERLAAEHPGWTVANASITGDTTRSGLSRLPRALDEHLPHIVIIALGGNDGLRGLSPAEIRNNLERMVELSRDAGAEVMLAGVRIPANYGPAYSQRFEQTFSQVAEAHDAPLLPSILAEVEQRTELFQADGIHPGESAQPVILDNVWSVLGPMIRG